MPSESKNGPTNSLDQASNRQVRHRIKHESHVKDFVLSNAEPAATSQVRALSRMKSTMGCIRRGSRFEEYGEKENKDVGRNVIGQWANKTWSAVQAKRVSIATWKTCRVHTLKQLKSKNMAHKESVSGFTAAWILERTLKDQSWINECKTCKPRPLRQTKKKTSQLLTG